MFEPVNNHLRDEDDDGRCEDAVKYAERWQHRNVDVRRREGREHGARDLKKIAQDNDREQQA